MSLLGHREAGRGRRSRRAQGLRTRMSGPITLSPQRRSEPLCVLRGGGDLATGVAWYLFEAGWPVVVLELTEPLTVRRTVGAVHRGDRRRGDRAGHEGRAGGVAPGGDGDDEARRCGRAGGPGAGGRWAPCGPTWWWTPGWPSAPSIHPWMTPIWWWPSGRVSTAGHDCHAVVETMRGSGLGRVMWRGSAQPDTGVPAELGGRSADRVLRAPVSGEVVLACGDRRAGRFGPTARHGRR